MHLDSHSYTLVPTNIFLSAVSGAVAFVSTLDPVVSAAIPVVLFIIGKTVDVLLQLHMRRKGRK